jgi:hypothetical protein
MFNELTEQNNCEKVSLLPGAKGQMYEDDHEEDEDDTPTSESGKRSKVSRANW